MELENCELLQELSQLSFPILQGSGKILRMKKSKSSKMNLSKLADAGYTHFSNTVIKSKIFLSMSEDT